MFALLSDALPLESLRAVFPYWFGTWFWQNCGLVSYVILAGPWKLSLPSDETCEFIDNHRYTILVPHFLCDTSSKRFSQWLGICAPQTLAKNMLFTGET